MHPIPHFTMHPVGHPHLTIHLLVSHESSRYISSVILLHHTSHLATSYKSSRYILQVVSRRLASPLATSHESSRNITSPLATHHDSSRCISRSSHCISRVISLHRTSHLTAPHDLCHCILQVISLHLTSHLSRSISLATSDSRLVFEFQRHDSRKAFRNLEATSMILTSHELKLCLGHWKYGVCEQCSEYKYQNRIWEKFTARVVSLSKAIEKIKGLRIIGIFLIRLPFKTILPK